MPNPTTQYTPNYQLENLYEGIKVDNDLFNHNWAIIDAALQELKEAIGMTDKIVYGNTLEGSTGSSVSAETLNIDVSSLDFDYVQLDCHFCRYNNAGYPLEDRKIIITKDQITTANQGWDGDVVIKWANNNQVLLRVLAYNNWHVTVTLHKYV